MSRYQLNDAELWELEEFLAFLRGKPVTIKLFRSHRVGWIFRRTVYDIYAEDVIPPAPPKPPVAKSLRILFGPSFYPSESNVDGILFLGQRALLSVMGVDEKGKPAPVENVSFESSNPDIVEIVEDGDGDDKTVYAQSKVTFGDVQITAKADPKIGEEVGELVAIGNISVKPREAVSLAINMGAPEDV